MGWRYPVGGCCRRLDDVVMNALKAAFLGACRHAEAYVAAHPDVTVTVCLGRGGGQGPAIHVLGMVGCETIEREQRERGRRFKVLVVYRRVV